MSFNELGLSAELLRAIENSGYTTPTPVQQQAIPVVIEGRDVLAGAQTGTGKTAGFTLPLLHRLQQSEGPKGHVRALILTPTRELAAQVGESVAEYGKFLPFKSTIIFGGVNINRQITALRKGVDIVIATPGRLLDHAGQRTIDLSHVEMLVLDEADRMLDMGFIRDIRRIIKLLPEKRQNLLFSATFSNEIKQLASGLLNNPAEVQASTRNKPAEKVKQVVHLVDRNRKRELLSHRIGSQDWKQVLVFTRTKHGANRLATQLTQDGLSAAAIHGNKSQGARTKALADFKAGSVRVLVATDIAARGLDIEALPHVVNFELPNVPEDYVHRIGRTARAGQEGEAMSLVCVDELKLLKDIERVLKASIPQQVIEGYEHDPSVTPEPLQKPRQARPPRRTGGVRAADGKGKSAAGGRGTGAGKGRRPGQGQGQKSQSQGQSRGNGGANSGNSSAARPEVNGNRRPSDGNADGNQRRSSGSGNAGQQRRAG